jgi:hypothetical protein
MMAMFSKFSRKTAARLLGAVMAVSLPLGSSAFGDLPRSYDDAATRVRAAQYSLDRDKSDLRAAQQRVDEITAARERQLKENPAIGDSRAAGDQAGAARDAAARDQAQLREQLKTNQAAVDSLKAKIDQQHAEALKKFEATDAFKAAYGSFDQARQELKKPTDAVLDQLAMSHEFQDAVTAARAAKGEEKRLRDSKPADPKAIAAAEAAFITADNKVQDMEEKALTADPTVVSLRQKVDGAQDGLKKLRDQMEQAFADDPANAPVIAELRQKQTAIEASSADLKRLDTQMAGSPAAYQPEGAGPAADRDARGQMDKINADLDNARQEAAKLEARVREDQDGLNYALQDREAYDRAALDTPSVIVERPVYDDTVIVPSYRERVYVDSGPVYDYPYYDSGVYLGFGGGYSTYRDRYGYGYRGYHDRDDDYGYWHDRDRDRGDDRGNDRSRDYSGSRDRADRLRQQERADHLAYRTEKDLRDTQRYTQSQEALHARRANEDAQRQSRVDYDNRKQVRENEALHAHRAVEDADRAAARQRESNPAPRSRSADPAPVVRPQEAPAPRYREAAPAPRQQEAPRSHEPAPRQQEAQRSHEAAPEPSHANPPAVTSSRQSDPSSNNSSDSSSHSHSRSR